MAAEIKPVEQSAGDNGFGIVKRLDLLSKIETMYTVNMAVLMGDDDEGIIGVSEDKSVRIWLKRDRGKYWPSVCQFLPAPATSVFYNVERRLLYVGLNNGTVVEFLVAEDGNKITHIRDMLAHIDKVTSIYMTPVQKWVLTGSRDKYFQWHCSDTGRKLGSYLVDVWISCLCFDAASQCVFIGDMSGQITVLNLSQSTSLITVLKGHSASVRSLAWDRERNLLFSGGGDSMIVVWDIGGKKGTTIELSGHQDTVECLLYIPTFNQLVSAGADCNIIFWNMDAQRKQMPVWSESNKCECCGGPFFWNFKTMWEIKSIGGRQHHCRKCGRAICARCSQKFSVLPRLGFEYPVRMCNECHASLQEEELSPLAVSYHSKHKIISMDIDVSKKIILTIGKDRIMKVWEMSDNWN